MKKISWLFPVFISGILSAQFTSPGNGTTYNLASLSAAAPTVLVNNGTDYTMKSNVTISANDHLVLDENTTLKIDAGILLTVAGTYNTSASNFTITASDPANVFKGIRLESTASANFSNTIIEYGGGIQCLTGNFVMDNCIVRYQKSGQSTGAAVNFSTGNPVVQNSQFIENDLPAVASGANQSVALTFQGNYLQGNTKLNSNRPQINMGPSGNGGTTKILNNTIIGNRLNNKVGGVSVSSLLGTTNNVLIDGNTISDNRFGVTVTGNNCSGTISNNIFTNNNVETNAINGGSGINLYGNGTFKIEKNQIRGSLWGLTLVGQTTADLGGGQLGSTGENIFYNNGNNGTLYALYNNTANAVNALNNCWREGELSTDIMVEDVIFHQVDDTTKGLVNFSPYLCGLTAAVTETQQKNFRIFPNPSRGSFTVETAQAGNYSIYELSGKLLYSAVAEKGKNKVEISAQPGMYILVFISDGKKTSENIIIK